MYKWTYDTGFNFVFDLSTTECTDGLLAETNEAEDNKLRFEILQQLVDNGAAIAEGVSFTVPAENIYSIDFADWIQLGLPDIYPYKIALNSDGALRRPDFRFRLVFCDFWPGGEVFSVKLNGPLIRLNDYEYILTPEQYTLVKETQRFNSLAETLQPQDHELLRVYGRVKKAAEAAEAELHQYIINENVLELDTFSIDVNYENEVLEVRPLIAPDNTVDNNDPTNSDTNEKFLKTFDRNLKIKEVYTLAGEGAVRTRVVVGPEAQSELKKIKTEYRKITDAKQQELFLRQTAKFLDPEIVDFEVVYSDRVIEIGVFKPKYYPFVSAYKSEWIPGIIREKNGVKTKVEIKNKNTLAEFKAVINEAEKENKQTVNFKGIEIDLQDAKRYFDFAERQLSQKDKRQKTVENRESGERVLVIMENAEENIFRPDGAQLIETGNFSFESVEGLKQGLELKDYQVEGVTWLQTLHRNDRNGGLLADDMGLGKTLQVLYFIEWLVRSKKLTKPILIIAPVALLENWEEEYNKFFPERTYPVEHLHNAGWLSKVPTAEVMDRLEKAAVFLANYETYRNYQLTLGAVDYAAVILDEAQRIKTPGTIITNAVKAIKSDFHIALTGTPVENSLVDLWCIVDYVAPGLLGSAKEFAKKYDRPLSKPETDIQALTDELRSRIGTFLCRRLKKDVLKHLPHKEEYYDDYRVTMPDIQMHRYKLELELAKGETPITSGEQTKQHILKTIRNLKYISEHPYLVEYDVLKFETDELIKTSAKLIATIDICDKIKSNGEKVIVFSDSKPVQAMLRKVFRDRYLLNCSIINGDTPAASVDKKNGRLSRQQTIRKFSESTGFNIIIMSPLAAGVGLNVTSANHVIHYSRHWNPAKEQQATDRAYRIGQEKNVHVYYPFAVADGFQTFDETLHGLLSRKKNLAEGALFPTERIEVSQKDVIDGLFGHSNNDDDFVRENPLRITDLDKIAADKFEAAIGAIYKKQGFDVDLTPYAGDSGADVVALKADSCCLIQCKRSSGAVDGRAVQEIVTAKRLYENRYGETFELCVVTNSVLTQGAHQLARENEVIVFEREQLSRLLDTNKILLSEVYLVERERRNTLI
ncbi:MAG: restriction endonuclease [Balneolales bacterium]|nr:restriction endonuclease [Balneolales bacterium]